MIEIIAAFLCVIYIFLILCSFFMLILLLWPRKKNRSFKELENISLDSEKIIYNYRRPSLVYIVAERVLDVLVALSGIIIVSPIIVFTSIQIKISTRGPLISVAEYVGYDCKKISLYKFRTTYSNLETENESVTLIGKFLRHYGLDKLPMLFNMLKGDISICGLGRYKWNEFEKLKDAGELFYYCKPGIFSLPMLLEGEEWLSYETWVLYDRYYLKNRSFLFNFKIIRKCILSDILIKS